jgi:phage/plasmid-associated DNA primase
LIGFDNGVYNLQTKQFEPKNKNYYMTMTTGYDYIEDEDQEGINTISDFFEKVFPIKEEGDLYGCLMMRSFFGKNLDKFIIANGGGGNGKSVIHNLNKKCQGGYAYVLPSVVLSKVVKDGPNPEIAGGSKKRFICSEEPEAKLGLCNSTIKQLTGGREGVRARMCNSNNTEYINICSLFINCNEKPKLQAEITNADARRILDIPFRSTFVKEIDLVDHEKYIFLAQKKYIDDEDFIMSLRIPYFKYLVNNYLDVVNGEGIDIDHVVPDSIKKRTLQYLSNSDYITNWFMETYEKTEDDTDLIQLKDVYDLFKLSEGYSNMNKQEKRTYTKSYFIEKIQNNIFLKSHYKDRERRKDILNRYGRSEMRQVLVGFKVKEEDEEDIPDNCLICDDDIQ